MKQSLLFIPDISGFTQFVQTTEPAHSQHIISELLEVLINTNHIGLKLAEIEGDALFFYREGPLPSQEKLLSQMEAMHTAFYSHLKRLDKNKICPCRACDEAMKLELKIVAHYGNIEFIEVQKSIKPFGLAVIEVHRLLKNSVPSDNYILMSQVLMQAIDMNAQYESKLFHFRESINTYDNKDVPYSYAIVNATNLNLNFYQNARFIEIEKRPNLITETIVNSSTLHLIELITNFKYRELWMPSIHDNENDTNEDLQLGVLNQSGLYFTPVTKIGLPGQTIYGELTRNFKGVNRLYKFYILESIDDTTTKLIVELFWFTKWPLDIIKMEFFTKSELRRSIINSLDNLKNLSTSLQLTSQI